VAFNIDILCCRDIYEAICRSNPAAEFFKEICPNVFTFNGDETGTFDCSDTDYDIIIEAGVKLAESPRLNLDCVRP
jgi:hypothetical protein